MIPPDTEFVWVIISTTGAHSDYTETPVRAFLDPDTADAEFKRLTLLAEELCVSRADYPVPLTASDAAEVLLGVNIDYAGVAFRVVKLPLVAKPQGLSSAPTVPYSE
jgi:hypothetical protein